MIYDKNELTKSSGVNKLISLFLFLILSIFLICLDGTKKSTFAPTYGHLHIKLHFSGDFGSGLGFRVRVMVRVRGVYPKVEPNGFSSNCYCSCKVTQISKISLKSCI